MQVVCSHTVKRANKQEPISKITARLLCVASTVSEPIPLSRAASGICMPSYRTQFIIVGQEFKVQGSHESIREANCVATVSQRAFRPCSELS